ncbi:ABC transporter permease [Actinoplanes sp. NBRC 101535]|uniref:ABC transporter permease n=1 Tax=Actinoplanes sp. NBRC 101535 TaxID=3032196 RepID=UPI0024A3D836|nr:ABC transporter permease [Actinoplanes sp. NBRC 101535]GLY02126.1 ABC transporter permease [Actinoplanes sp. NBRC 101535]
MMLTQILVSGLGLALPLLIAAVGELVSERAGVLNLSLEAMMLTGAFTAVTGTVLTGSAWLGAACGLCGGLLVGLAQTLLSVRLRADQIVVGVAANALALAATTFGARLLLDGDRGVTGFERLPIPVLADVPVIGPVLFAQTALGYLCAGVVLVTGLLLGPRTGWGLRIDATGEDAGAADWTGLPVRRIRALCILLTSALAGLGGAQLALSEVHAFSDNMTAGIGYLAVVAVIAGRWRTPGTVVAAVAFGVAQALQYALPAAGVGLPPAVLTMIPYLVAIVAVSGLAGASRAPSCLTVPFVRA